MHHSSPRVLIVACIFCLTVALAGSGSQPAMADPDRPIRLLVPYPAGGPNDVIARLIADKLDDSLGQQVIVENRPAGSGNTAVVAAARAAPDGAVAAT